MITVGGMANGYDFEESFQLPKDARTFLYYCEQYSMAWPTYVVVSSVGLDDVRAEGDYYEIRQFLDGFPG